MKEILAKWSIGPVATIEPTLFGGGKTFFVTTVSDGCFVLKKGADLPRVQRECALLLELSKAGVPVPAPIVTVDGDSYAVGSEGQTFRLYPRLPGKIATEHYGGDFPLWLAPVQAKVIPISRDHLEYGIQVADLLRKEGLRIELDRRDEKVGYKIRDAETLKTPYMLIMGEKEVTRAPVSASSSAIRLRTVPFTAVKSPATTIRLPSPDAAVASPWAFSDGFQEDFRTPVVRSKARMFSRGVSFFPGAAPAGRAEENSPVT